MRTDRAGGAAGAPAETAHDLTGTWSLLSFHETDETGTAVQEGPLGPLPSGRLVYLPDGQVSVHMMRDPHAPAGTPFYMGYAGTWRLVDGATVAHRIAITPRPDWVGTEQMRDLVLEGDRLTLHASTRIRGVLHHRVLVWQRVT
ncbi:lipocalin-like domain-containing protein [Streptomyces sioyaensis]|uniref:lipocalin-like domain-containing protein n=1 Tax=Streptomyces sioyaensis TaxID=67364 RepID=UPI001F46F0B0|nr:lipocalin-like domain-containing protein [Streptomyces sioyaensis]MCF3175867.1 lipocalin-like domain-containing protein [Streptomyces sioyaensis]